MEHRGDPTRRLLACLSDPSRFRIVRILGGAERCVTEIAGAVGLSQSCTTRHLQALGRDRIVRRRRDGKRVLFRLDERDDAVRGLLGWLGAGEPSDRDAEGARAAPGRWKAAVPAQVRHREAPGATPERPAAPGSPGTVRRPAGKGGGARGARRGADPPAGPGGPTTPDQEATPAKDVAPPDPGVPAEADSGGGGGRARPPLARPGDLEDYLL